MKTLRENKSTTTDPFWSCVFVDYFRRVEILNNIIPQLHLSVWKLKKDVFFYHCKSDCWLRLCICDIFSKKKKVNDYWNITRTSERRCALVLPYISSTIPKPHPYSLIHILIGWAAGNSLHSFSSPTAFFLPSCSLSLPPVSAFPSHPSSLPLQFPPLHLPLHAACQWMSPVRHKLFNSAVSLSLSLTHLFYSLSLCPLPSLEQTVSGASARHQSGTGLTEEDEVDNCWQKTIKNIYGRTSIVIQLKAEQKQQIALTCNCCYNWCSGLGNEADWEQLLASRGQFLCLKEMLLLCTKRKELTVLSDRNQKLWFSRKATRCWASAPPPPSVSPHIHIFLSTPGSKEEIRALNAQTGGC